MITDTFLSLPKRSKAYTMSTKRIFVPDDIIRPARPGENTHIRLLQYVNSTTQENYDAFLTHYAMVYILSGVKQIKVAKNKFQIQSGELFLIPRGEYVMSEYITGEKGFQSLMLFFSKKVAQDLIEQISSYLSNHINNATPMKKEAVKIIPHNTDIEKIFSAIAAYSNGESPFICELLKLKFTELIFLLLDSPYQQLILSFLLDAARGENPSLSSVIENHLYSSATVNELAILSGRSLSSFKREFSLQYNEPPRSWIRKKKLERAAYLLDTSDKTIEEIAETSGFVSSPHFTRLFKEHYQFTPSEYRTKQTKS